MNCFYYTLGHLSLSISNCHGEKITFIFIYKSHLSTFSLPKNEVVFLGLFVQYFHRTLIYDVSANSTSSDHRFR